MSELSEFPFFSGKVSEKNRHEPSMTWVGRTHITCEMISFPNDPMIQKVNVESQLPRNIQKYPEMSRNIQKYPEMHIIHDLRCRNASKIMILEFLDGLSSWKQLVPTAPLAPPYESTAHKATPARYLRTRQGASLRPKFPPEQIHGSLNVPIEHHPTIRYMVYNGYYFWWCPIYPKWDSYQPLRYWNLAMAWMNLE